MFFILYAVFLPALVASAGAGVTFKNVVIKGYSVYTQKFTKTITAAESIKEELPKEVFDYLEIKDQYIPVLKENSISDLEYLDQISIENCRLAEIQPGALKNVPLLRELSLKNNDIERIPTGIFNNLQIYRLDLSKNRITEVDATAFNNMPNLLNINLADNLIDSWDNRWFHDTPQLSRISMQNNSLRQLPAKAFENLNRNKNFGSHNLTLSLIFSYNKISEIDKNAFSGINNIKNLWLDNNNLINFDEYLLEHVEVEDLRIEHNQIKCLKGDLGKILKAETSHLDGNPFECNCVEDIKKWANQHDKNVDVFYSDMKCRADRISKKLTDIEKRIKELQDIKDRDIELVTKPPNKKPTYVEPEPDDEAEIIFK